jgi:hypothetical protein
MCLNIYSERLELIELLQRDGARPSVLARLTALDTASQEMLDLDTGHPHQNMHNKREHFINVNDMVAMRHRKSLVTSFSYAR